jgi:hypothetical protein
VDRSPEWDVSDDYCKWRATLEGKFYKTKTKARFPSKRGNRA